MLFKAAIILLFVVILASLASALMALIRGRGDPERTVRALTVRIVLSVALFILLLLGYSFGLIQPHSIQPYSVHPGLNQPPSGQ